MSVEWKCPRCGATPEAHGKKLPDPLCRGSRECRGFLCECEVDTKEHGTSLADVCAQANCYHCGWGGVFPSKPKRAAPWEVKALQAGWTPPADRAKELGS